MNKEGMCSMLTATCRWVPARLIAAHCKANPENPDQKAVCEANKHNQQVCGALAAFCDWVPAEKVYDGKSGGSMSGEPMSEEDMSAFSEPESPTVGPDDGKCRAIPGIPGFAAHDINCGAMNKEGMCSMLTATCRWVPARLIAAHCKAKPDQPNQKAVCQANRNNGMVCTRLPQFCDWVPAEKVYD